MSRIGSRVGGPAMAVSLATVRDIGRAALGFLPYHVMRRQLRQAPFPEGASEGSLPGDWPVLVTVIGEATAIGYQTLTSDLTLGAQLARRIDRDSRRGVRWQALTTSDYSIRTAQKLFRDNPQLILADVVVVLLGIGDSFRFTPPWVWRKHLRILLADLRAHLGEPAVILVAEVPPLELSSETPARMARRVGEQARLLNEETRSVVAGFHGTVSVPFPTAMVHEFTTSDGHDTFYGRVYRSWAAVMAEHIRM
ncbi:esterase [Clavibacter michiganensis]|nr:esterase [Clavibacter michiganensis]